MNRLWSILTAVLSISIFCGCDATTDTNIDQRDDIVYYLNYTHSPKLISESEAQESLDDNPPFYTRSGGYTFMYVENYYDGVRESMPQIKSGSEVSMTFSLYDFEDTTAPSTSTLLYSNDADVIAELVALGMNAEYWTDEPLTITIGRGDTFTSVESMLMGCYEGDVIEFYMTLSDAYGSSVIGLSTADEPLALFCEILEVK